jgi:hypothetical protein
MFLKSAYWLVCFISFQFGCYATNDLLIREEGKLPETGEYCLKKPVNRYFLKRIQPEPTNEFVWNRVTNGNNADPAVLCVGYENIVTQYGDEGTDICYNTPTCSRIAFFSGGIPGKERVSAEMYNHIYADFFKLQEDVPYMLGSNFFNCIVIGVDTFRYITRKSMIDDFASMLKKDGAMVFPLNYGDSTLISLTEILNDFSVALYSKEPKVDISLFPKGQEIQNRLIKYQQEQSNLRRIKDLSVRYKVSESLFLPMPETIELLLKCEDVHPFIKRCFNKITYDDNHPEGYAIATSI